ncbi:SIR2 family protein [Flavobacterium coralii]|uniref:SIR2 family protein n=1 Tax=Flavobacterium coralii TaxID=2838017 RepID=UPI000C464F8C|nr:hypothetical protein [Flavobacterium sp.]|tara:strand:- start:2901 stop:4415 length:1515 start_codon:yes stop_codon:yes gene_type:complete
MKIEDLLTEEQGARGFIAFETFVVNLLKIHVQKQGKPFIIAPEYKIGDALASEGFDEFKGSTLIEVKVIARGGRFRSIIENFTFRPLEIRQVKNLIVITPTPVSVIQNILNEYSHSELFLKIKYDEVNITFWGPDEINKIINKHKKDAISLANNLFYLKVENAVKAEKDNWEIEREEKVTLLEKYYERGQFSFFLGAGVSSSAGMPDWNTLLNSLFVSYLTKEFTDNASVSDNDIREIVKRLNNIDEPSALMAARYLRKGLSKEIKEVKEFTKTITESLYKLRDTTKDKNSVLITTIANLCMPKRTGAKVKSVVTYNFDDLLESQLDASSIRRHSIYSENEYYDPDELPIYHVHGFLPENSENYQRLEKSTLVFSEEGYHQIYSDPYHWSNLVQLTNLRENNCVMVGLSMTDPNLRRLLDISSRDIEAPRHFAFMRRMTVDRFLQSNSSEKDNVSTISNLPAAKQFLKSHHKLNEQIMEELGVSVIWFEEFEEIPKILSKLNGV